MTTVKAAKKANYAINKGSFPNQVDWFFQGIELEDNKTLQE
jgi:hypothetical protein